MKREALPEQLERELVEQLQNLIANEPGRAPGEFTTREFAEIQGCAPDAARRRLHKLFKSGEVEPVRVDSINPWGERNRVKGWRLCGE